MHLPMPFCLISFPCAFFHQASLLIFHSFAHNKQASRREEIRLILCSYSLFNCLSLAFNVISYLFSTSFSFAPFEWPACLLAFLLSVSTHLIPCFRDGDSHARIRAHTLTPTDRLLTACAFLSAIRSVTCSSQELLWFGTTSKWCRTPTKAISGWASTILAPSRSKYVCLPVCATNSLAGSRGSRVKTLSFASHPVFV